MSIGGSAKTRDFPYVMLSLCLIPGIGLFLILMYLISLKRKRLKAEAWLERHDGVLFGSTWGSMTEVEILESLVKNRGLAQTLANPNQLTMSGGSDKKTTSGSEDESSDDGTERSSKSSKRKSDGSNRLSVITESQDANRSSQHSL